MVIVSEAVAVYVTPLKVKWVANGQTVVKTSTVVVTQVSLVQAETDAARPATKASLANCILTDLGGIKDLLGSNQGRVGGKKGW
jgi:hypothetical protein